MKELQSIPIDQFTSTQQQTYDKQLRFITDTNQTVKNLSHVYRGEIKWSPHYKNPKTSNDCGISLKSIE